MSSKDVIIFTVLDKPNTIGTYHSITSRIDLKQLNVDTASTLSNTNMHNACTSDIVEVGLMGCNAICGIYLQINEAIQPRTQTTSPL
jgi:hypothetical protein